jgi:hypothetical protein
MYTFIVKIVRRGIHPPMPFLVGKGVPNPLHHDTWLPVIRLQAHDHQEALDSAALLVGAHPLYTLTVTADEYLIAHTVECSHLHLYGVFFDITIIVE